MDAGSTNDAGAIDAGSVDAGSVDAGAMDAGSDDAGAMDAGSDDAGAVDAGVADAGAMDAGVTDAGPTDAGSCTSVTLAPDVDPWSMRLPGIGTSGVLTQTTGGHQDVFLKSPPPQADYTRIGVRLDWGGTIVFWGLGASPSSNTIDANDTGREVQIALYDPARNRQQCAWNASCLTTSASCGNSITYLGWNPVQGGDECNRGASTTWSVVGDALRVTVTPVQWNPDWDAMDCRNSGCSGQARPAQVQYVMDLRFVAPLVVEVSLEVTSSETIDHGVTGQEFPTMYVAHGGGGLPDLPVLLDAAGNAVTIDVPANDGFVMKDFTSPAPWVAFQNTAHDYGVGLAMDQGVTGFQGWGGNGSTAPYFHNVRAHLAFGLSHGATVRGRAYLALGSFSTIATSLQQVFAARPAFGVVDVPAQGATITSNTVALSGWALAAEDLAQVAVEYDGQPLTTLPVNQARADVCAVYPNYPACPAVGYSGTVTLPAADGCAHVLRVVANTSAGVRSVLGERRVLR